MLWFECYLFSKSHVLETWPQCGSVVGDGGCGTFKRQCNVGGPKDTGALLWEEIDVVLLGPWLILMRELFQ